MLNKDEVETKLKKQLEEFSAEIDALEEKAHEVKEHARAKYQEQLVALRAKRQEGQKKLEEMKVATESSWDRLKAETDNVWEALRDSVNVLKTHFKSREDIDKD